MRGGDGTQGAMFSYVSLEDRVPADHPLRVVRRLVDGAVPEGAHPIAWDGNDDAGRRVPSGVYFARASSGESDATLKLVLLE